MENKSIDFHVHSTRSDGRYTPEEITDIAVMNGIGMIALTDHNVLAPSNIEDLEKRHTGNLKILRGSEISCCYTFKNDMIKEIHVVVLLYDKEAPNLNKVVIKNQEHNRKGYICSILRKLRECGIDIGTYEDLCAGAVGSCHVGRMHIAERMKDMGFVHTIDEAFDIYIGDFGLKKAFVSSGIEYVSMEEAVHAALCDGAIPVLAHLFYYSLNEMEQEELLQAFKRYAGDFGALETEYARYNENQRIILRRYADRFGFARSCASDFHGFDSNDSLSNNFSITIYEGILEKKKKLDAFRGTNSVFN